MSEVIYVTYLTIYSGNKLPPYYIGYTTEDKIKNGYCGSVQSKKYGVIWKSELKNNFDLFETLIISKHSTRVDALIEELKLQKNHNVVKSDLFINMAYAQPNGFFGMDNSGVNHPNYDKELGKCKCFFPWFLEPDKYTHPMKGKHHSDFTKEKMRISKLGKRRSLESIQKQIITMTGRKRPKSVCEKISKAKMGKLNYMARPIKVIFSNDITIYYDCLSDFAREYEFPRNSISKVKQYSLRNNNYYSKKYKCRIENVQKE